MKLIPKYQNAPGPLTIMRDPTNKETSDFYNRGNILDKYGRVKLDIPETSFSSLFKGKNYFDEAQLSPELEARMRLKIPEGKPIYNIDVYNDWVDRIKEYNEQQATKYIPGYASKKIDFDRTQKHNLEKQGFGKYASEFAYPLLGAMTIIPTAGAFALYGGGAAAAPLLEKGASWGGRALNWMGKGLRTLGRDFSSQAAQQAYRRLLQAGLIGGTGNLISQYYTGRNFDYHLGKDLVVPVINTYADNVNPDLRIESDRATEFVGALANPLYSPLKPTALPLISELNAAGKRVFNMFGAPREVTFMNQTLRQNPINNLNISRGLTKEEILGLPKHARRELGKVSPSAKYLRELHALEDRADAMKWARKKLESSNELGVDEQLAQTNTKISTKAVATENSYRDGYANVGFGRNNHSGHSYGMNLGGMASRRSDVSGERIAYEPYENSKYVVTEADVNETKRGVKDMVEAMKGMSPGTEISGDAVSTTPGEAAAAWLRVAKKPELKQVALENAKIALEKNAGISLGTHDIWDPMHNVTTVNAGMSPDAVSFMYRTAQNNPSIFSIAYSSKPAGAFNSFARHPLNKYMYDLEQQYLNGTITPQQFANQYNEWILPFGGRKAYVDNGVVIRPQPYLMHKAHGGKLIHK